MFPLKQAKTGQVKCHSTRNGIIGVQDFPLSATTCKPEKQRVHKSHTTTTKLFLTAFFKIPLVTSSIMELSTNCDGAFPQLSTSQIY